MTPPRHKQAHDWAMFWVGCADAAESGDARAEALKKALAFEVFAARNVGDDVLTRAMLYRSAATIALRVNATKTVVSMIAELLETDGVPRDTLREIAEILRALELPDSATVDETVEGVQELIGEHVLQAEHATS